MKEEKQKISNITMIVIIIALLAIVFFAATMVLDKKADNINIYTDNIPEKQTLSSSGTVTKYVTPDKVEISLTIETLDISAQKSQSDNAVIADKTINALKQAGVLETQIKTTSYYVYEEYQWNKTIEKSESIGYKTTNTIQVTLYDTTKAGEIVDIAIQSGVNKIGGISFGLTEAKELEVKQIALKEASETAKRKAESIASGLNLTISNVSSVQESNAYYAPNYKSYDMVEQTAGSDGVRTPVIAGEVQVTASVSVVFEIE